MPNQPQIFYEINEFDVFLERCLQKKIVSHTVNPLTKPGDNYGSIMQSISVKIAGEKGCEEETLHLVSKTPVTNPYLIEIFQPALTFVKETHFYSDIIPAIEAFEEMSNVPKSHRIDAFIHCPGSRISLNPNAKFADIDAVLLLENIKLQNYFNEDRCIGFDTEATMAILKTLAQFHALCIAMRRLQPRLFKTKVSPYLKTVNANPEDDSKFVDSLCKELNYVKNLDSDVRIVIEKLVRQSHLLGKETSQADDTPYTTVNHRDLWTNNIMIKKVDLSDEPIKVKIYDFQLYFYETFVTDLMLFLFTSVRCDELTENFILFICHYYSEFNKTMKLVNCRQEDYTFFKMWKEIKAKTKLELYNIFFMTKIAMANESESPSLDEVNPDTFCMERLPSEALLNRWECIIGICEKYELA